MYSGFRQFTPRAAASATSTLVSSGFSLLKSAKRWVASLKRDTEWPENTYGLKHNRQKRVYFLFLPQDKCSSWPVILLIKLTSKPTGNKDIRYSCVLCHHVPFKKGDPSHQSRHRNSTLNSHQHYWLVWLQTSCSAWPLAKWRWHSFFLPPFDHVSAIPYKQFCWLRPFTHMKNAQHRV